MQYNDLNEQNMRHATSNYNAENLDLYMHHWRWPHLYGSSVRTLQALKTETRSIRLKCS